jgi:hypothetical protein
MNSRILVARMAMTWTTLVLCPVAQAQQVITLMAPKESWSFNNGAEFPGATGGLTVDTQAKPEGGTTFKLVGDFTKGGRYVQAGRKIDKVDLRELSMWVRNPDAAKLTIRLTDASGQTHQIALRLEAKPDWQKVVFPVEGFFARRGQADAVTTVTKYESWGGAKDGRWHGPATGLYILLSNPPAAGEGGKVRTLWLHDIAILPRPTAVRGADVATILPLDEIVEGEHDWRFTRGEEFKGAKGSLTVVKDQPTAGQSCLKLAGDFSAGGAYVAAIKDLGDLGVKDVVAFHLRVKSDTGASLRIQLKDATGQTHQRARMPIAADGQWHDLVIKPAEVAGGEHWGGANDGKWHGPPLQMAISLAPHAKDIAKLPIIFLASVRAEALLPAFVQPAAFKSDFETADKLDQNWTTQGAVAIDTKTAFQGGRSLVLSRSLEAVERPCSATGPPFAAAPGKWEIRLAGKPDLHSPDNSYNGVVSLECLDATGKIIERFTLADLFGKRDWQQINKQIELPKGVATARFHIQLNKTYGRFWLDELSAAYLAPAPRKDDRIARLLFATAQLGNLLLPGDPRQVSVSVEAVKPLRDNQLTLSYEVRDYWGAEQMRPRTVLLQRSEKKGPTPGANATGLAFTYVASIDLSEVPLEIGRYYELHAAIPQEGNEPFRNFTSFAILPEADTKRLKPEEVPFTSRNWDNRITAYFQLSDRLGLRTCGVWGGWSAKPPYKAEAPSIELCQKLGMGVVTRTPIATIEQGKKDYDETALRQGMRNWIEKYGKYRPLTISLGNEPHGTGDRVQTNVAAYRIVYEEVKKIDPTIFVLATAVEPNEEYFQAGYGKWCDAYDFHVYEGFANVRKTIAQYQELSKKYGQVKPIWSTELGLNSQGLPRHVVAVELTKTCTTFFAAGGANASWFGLLYPDPDAKSYGSSGDSHNVFDCRYNRYAPRLDAVAYYHAVNAIGSKKFREEKQYPDGISAFLFRDAAGRTLQVLWKSKGRQDVLVPLPGVKEVQVVRTDGRHRSLDAGGKGITLSITEDPLLLLYEGDEVQLAKELGIPAATLQSLPQTRSRRGSTTLTVALNSGSADELDLIAPPFWAVKKEQLPGENGSPPAVHFTLTAPEASSVREADLIVTLGGANRNPQGELYYRLGISE